jgi:hypothetical protein
MSLTTRANVKAFKNIATADTAHDAEIDRLIPVLGAFIARHCNRVIEQATVTEYHSTREGQTTLRLKQYPVASITSLYDDPDRVYGSDTLLATTDYVLEDGNAGLVRLAGIVFGAGINNVKAVYPGGFASGSDDLKIIEEAAIELIWLTRDLGDKALLGITSKSIADGSVTTFQRSRIDAVREILDNYRKKDH